MLGRDERRALLISGLVGLGVGSLVYDVVVRLLIHIDVAVPLVRASHVDGRDLVLRVVPAVALIAAVLVAVRLPATWPVPRVWFACGVLMVAGWSWVGWGLVDQHLLHLFDIAPDSAHPLVWDVLFHGAGAVAGAVGWNILDAVRRRPSPWDELARKNR